MQAAFCTMGMIVGLGIGNYLGWKMGGVYRLALRWAALTVLAAQQLYCVDGPTPERPPTAVLAPTHQLFGTWRPC